SRADNQAAASLIGKLFSARILNFITDEKTDLIAYGLEEPVYEITLLSREETTQTLLIGNTLPNNPDVRYAKRIETDSVFTVPAEWIKELDIDANLLRSRRLIHWAPEQITGIELTSGERQIELTCTSNQWQIVRPVRWDVDSVRVTELLKLLTEASVTEFLNNPSAEQLAQIKTPAWNITLRANGKTSTLHISEAKTNDLCLVQYDESLSLGTTAASITRNVSVDPLFYRSRNVLELNPAMIQTITLQRTGQPEQSVQKSEIDSFFAGKPDRQVDPETLTGIMWELIDLTAVRDVDFNPATLQPYGLDQPQASLTVTLSNTNAIGRVILIGSKTDDGRFATIQGMDVVFVVSEKTAQTLTRELTVPIEKQPEQIKEP
ncbi:MAG: DUF4340 domain-containing protein, partial [Pontiellaceae bacterium]|nr:DUF4340 domain-containing protein [Pontiellaceae bacterium]